MIKETQKDEGAIKNDQLRHINDNKYKPGHHK